jgi:hypothetical protein
MLSVVRLAAVRLSVEAPICPTKKSEQAITGLSVSSTCCNSHRSNNTFLFVIYSQFRLTCNFTKKLHLVKIAFHGVKI